jgi:hypothetical protein
MLNHAAIDSGIPGESATQRLGISAYPAYGYGYPAYGYGYPAYYGDGPRPYYGYYYPRY